MAENNIPLFLNEKFIPNQLPEVCAPRRELLKLFERASRDRFVYVGAQAGSGKTFSTLLWLASNERRAIWIGLNKYDNSPSIFYKQLASGIYSLFPENTAMRSILVSPDFSASPVEHTIQLICELPPDAGSYALVLDDMHLITNSEVAKSLPAVLKYLPISFVTLILSRHQIAPEYLPLVKDDNVDIITAAHLRFSNREIKGYFESLGHPLSDKDAACAYEITDGWAIGVNALAKSGELSIYTGDGFSGYFKAQVWDKWDEALQDFCLKTAVADEFTPDLAAALTGRQDAGTLMEQLSRTNSFISCLHGDTYRYHHLFQDFLRDMLEASGLDAAALHKAAADYYKEQGDYTTALRFRLNSGDYKDMDDYLLLFLFENHRGIVADYADFLRPFFVQEFPPRAYREFPALHVLSAWYYYLTSRHEEYAVHMDAIIRNLPRIAMINGKFVEFAILAFSVDHRLSMKEKAKKYNMFGRFVKRYTPEGLATSIASFSHNMPYMHRSNLDYSDLAQDEHALELIDKTFARLLGAEWTYIRPGLEACFIYERNMLPAALEKNTLALSLITDENKIEGRICAEVLQHTILWQLGASCHAQANAALERLTQLVDSQAQFFLPNLNAYQTKLKLLNGDRLEAAAWLENYYVVETDHIELFQSFQHFTTARAYVVLGETEEAEHYLLMLEEYGKNLNRPLDEAEAQVLLSAIWWAAGHRKEALDKLRSALDRMEPFGFIRVIADEGAAILPILKRIQSEANEANDSNTAMRSYINEVILAAHSMSKRCSGVIMAKERKKALKLSKQQKNMLLYYSQGYKNAEIAEMTGLSIPTIKSHASVAYRKLEVNNSLDAVLKARELGLI